jgi:hypothetical protein
MRCRAYQGAIIMQLFNYMRSTKPMATRAGPQRTSIADLAGRNIFKHFMEAFPSCYTPQPVVTQYYLEESDFGDEGWRMCLQVFSPGLNPNLET